MPAESEWENPNAGGSGGGGGSGTGGGSSTKSKKKKKKKKVDHQQSGGGGKSHGTGGGSSTKKKTGGGNRWNRERRARERARLQQRVESRSRAMARQRRIAARKERMAELVQRTARWLKKRSPNVQTPSGSDRGAKMAREAEKRAADIRQQAEAKRQVFEQRQAAQGALARAAAWMRAGVADRARAEQQRAREHQQAAAAAYRKSLQRKQAFERHVAFERAAQTQRRLLARAHEVRRRAYQEKLGKTLSGTRATTPAAAPSGPHDLVSQRRFTPPQRRINRYQSYDLKDVRTGKELEQEMDALSKRQSVSSGNDFTTEELDALTNQYVKYGDEVANGFQRKLARLDGLMEKVNDKKLSITTRRKAVGEYNRIISSAEFKELLREHRRLYGKEHDGSSGTFRKFGEKVDAAAKKQGEFLQAKYYGGSLTVALGDANMASALDEVDRTRGGEFVWVNGKLQFKRRTLEEELRFREKRTQTAMQAAYAEGVIQRRKVTSSNMADPHFAAVSEFLARNDITKEQLTTNPHGVKGVIDDMMDEWDERVGPTITAHTGPISRFNWESVYVSGMPETQQDQSVADRTLRARKRDEYERGLYRIFGSSPPDIFGRTFQLPIVEGALNMLGLPFAAAGAGTRLLGSLRGGEFVGPEAGFDPLQWIAGLNPNASKEEKDKALLSFAKYTGQHLNKGAIGFDRGPEAGKRSREEWQAFVDRFRETNGDIWAQARVTNEYGNEPLRQGSILSNFALQAVLDPTNVVPLAIWRYPQRIAYATRIAKTVRESKGTMVALKRGATSFLRVNEEFLDAEKRASQLIAQHSGMSATKVLDRLRDEVAGIKTASDMDAAVDRIMTALKVKKADVEMEQLRHEIETMLVQHVRSAGETIKTQVDEIVERQRRTEQAIKDRKARQEEAARESARREKELNEAKRADAVAAGSSSRGRLQATKAEDARRIANEDVKAPARPPKTAKERVDAKPPQRPKRPVKTKPTEQAPPPVEPKKPTVQEEARDYVETREPGTPKSEAKLKEVILKPRPGVQPPPVVRAVDPAPPVAFQPIGRQLPDRKAIQARKDELARGGSVQTGPRVHVPEAPKSAPTHASKLRDTHAKARVAESIHTGGSRNAAVWNEEAEVVARHLPKAIPDEGSILWVPNSRMRHTDEAKMYLDGLNHADPEVRAVSYYNLKRLADGERGAKALGYRRATRNQPVTPREYVDTMGAKTQSDSLKAQNLAREVSEARRTLAQKRKPPAIGPAETRPRPMKKQKETFDRVYVDGEIVERGDHAGADVIDFGADARQYFIAGRAGDLYRPLSITNLPRGRMKNWQPWQRAVLSRTSLSKLTPLKFGRFMFRTAEMLDEGQGVFNFANSIEPLFVMFHRLLDDGVNVPDDLMSDLHDMAFHFANRGDQQLELVGATWLLMEARAGLSFALPSFAVEAMWKQAARRNDIIPELGLGMFAGGFKVNTNPHTFGLGSDFARIIDSPAAAKRWVGDFAGRVTDPKLFNDIMPLLFNKKGRFDALMRGWTGLHEAAIAQGGLFQTAAFRQKLLQHSMHAEVEAAVAAGRKLPPDIQRAYDTIKTHGLGVGYRDKNNKLWYANYSNRSVKAFTEKTFDAGEPLASASAEIARFLTKHIETPPRGEEWVSRATTFWKRMQQAGHGKAAAEFLTDLHFGRFRAFQQNLLDSVSGIPDMAARLDAVGKAYQSPQGRLFYASGRLPKADESSWSARGELNFRKQTEDLEESEEFRRTWAGQEQETAESLPYANSSMPELELVTTKLLEDIAGSDGKMRLVAYRDLREVLGRAMRVLAEPAGESAAGIAGAQRIILQAQTQLGVDSKFLRDVGAKFMPKKRPQTIAGRDAASARAAAREVKPSVEVAPTPGFVPERTGPPTDPGVISGPSKRIDLHGGVSDGVKPADVAPSAPPRTGVQDSWEGRKLFNNRERVGDGLDPVRYTVVSDDGTNVVLRPEWSEDHELKGVRDIRMTKSELSSRDWREDGRELDRLGAPPRATPLVAPQGTARAVNKPNVVWVPRGWLAPPNEASADEVVDSVRDAVRRGDPVEPVQAYRGVDPSAKKSVLENPRPWDLQVEDGAHRIWGFRAAGAEHVPVEFQSAEDMEMWLARAKRDDGPQPVRADAPRAAPEPKAQPKAPEPWTQDQLNDFRTQYYAKDGPEWVEVYHGSSNVTALLTEGSFKQARGGLDAIQGAQRKGFFFAPDITYAEQYAGYGKNMGVQHVDPGIVKVRVRRGTGSLNNVELRLHENELPGNVEIVGRVEVDGTPSPEQMRGEYTPAEPPPPAPPSENLTGALGYDDPDDLHHYYRMQEQVERLTGLPEATYYRALRATNVRQMRRMRQGSPAWKKLRDELGDIDRALRAIDAEKRRGVYFTGKRRKARSNEVVKNVGAQTHGVVPPRKYAYFAETPEAADVEAARAIHRMIHDTSVKSDVGFPRDQFSKFAPHEWEELNALVTLRVREVQAKNRVVQSVPEHHIDDPTDDLLKTKRDSDPATHAAKQRALDEWAAKTGRPAMTMEMYDRVRTLLEGHMGRARRSKFILKAATEKGGDVRQNFLDIRQARTDKDAEEALRKLAFQNPTLTDRELLDQFELAWSNDGTLRVDPVTITEFDQHVLKTHFRFLTGADYHDDLAVMEALGAHGTLPPLDKRYDFRAAQTAIGSWSPRDADAIASGKKAWSVEDEQAWWEANYRRVPPWLSDQRFLSGEIFHDRDVYQKWNVDVGNYDRTVAQNARLAEGAGVTAKDLARGNPELGIKAQRDFDIQRRFAIERYGSRVWDGEKLTGMPWLMTKEELGEYAAKGGDVSSYLTGDALDAYRQAVSKVIAKRFPAYLERLHDANWGARIRNENPGEVVLTSEDVHEFAYEVLSELMYTYRFHATDIVADGIDVWGKLWRSLVMSQVGFTVTNVLDSGLKGSIFRFNRRSLIDEGSDVGRQRIPTLETLGEGEFTALVYGASRRNFKERMAGDTTYGWKDRGGALLDLMAVGIAKKFAGPAENANKLRLAQELYGGLLREFGPKFRAAGHAEEAVDLLVKKMVKDELNRIFPTLRNAGPFEKFLNQLSPFLSYTFKNQVLWVREAFQHPWMLNTIDSMQTAIVAYNEQEWARTHPGEPLPDELAFKVPLGNDLWFDISQMSDASRGLKTLYDGGDTVGELSNRFFRVMSPQQRALMNAVTDGLGITGRLMWVQGKNPDGSPNGEWTQVKVPLGTPWTGEAFKPGDLLWPVELLDRFGELAKDGTMDSRDQMLLLSRLLFFKEFSQPDRIQHLVNGYFELMDRSPEQARAFLLTEDGKLVEQYLRSAAFRPREFLVDPDLFLTPEQMSDPKLMRKRWLGGQTDEFRTRLFAGYEELARVNEKYDAKRAAIGFDPNAESVARLRQERRAAVLDVYKRYPEMVKYDAMGKTAEEWANTLQQWQIDEETNQFFDMFGKRPKIEDFKTEQAYEKALKRWERLRADYLVAHPGVDDRLNTVRTNFDRAQAKVQEAYDEVFERVGRRNRRIEAARQRGDQEALEREFYLADLDQQVLEREGFARGWDPDEAGRWSIIPDFNLSRWRNATPEERVNIEQDRRIKDIQKAAGRGKKFDPSKWYRMMNNHPELRERYFATHPGSREKWAHDAQYVHFWGRQAKLAQAGKWDQWWDAFDSSPDWVKDRYYDANPEKRREHVRNTAYISYMGKWMDAMDRGRTSGFRYFDNLPDWVKDRYFATHPNTKMRRDGGPGYGGNTPYSRALNRMFDAMDAGNWDAAEAAWNNMPDRFRERYLRQNPGSGLADGFGGGFGKRPTGSSPYSRALSRMFDAMDAGDWDAAEAAWNNMPDRFRERYLRDNPGSSLKDGFGKDFPDGGGFSGGGSGGGISDAQFKTYMSHMKKWVSLMQSGKKDAANDYFRSMPKWAQDFYIKQHPDKEMLKYEDAMTRKLALYFAADAAHQAAMLRDDPSIAAFLKSHAGDSARLNAIMFAYTKLPDDPWLKRMYREKYPEVFSPEARGERRIAGILEKLSEHPEFADEWVEQLEAIWSGAEEAMKYMKTPKRMLEPDRKRRRRKHTNSYSAAEVRERMDTAA